MRSVAAVEGAHGANFIRRALAHDGHAELVRERARGFPPPRLRVAGNGRVSLPFPAAVRVRVVAVVVVFVPGDLHARLVAQPPDVGRSIQANVGVELKGAEGGY
eukprot:30971-Pelagococcus_subviridis.AAC.11